MAALFSAENLQELENIWEVVDADSCFKAHDSFASWHLTPDPSPEERGVMQREI
jgi:hypothetical protein